jgi:two-component system, cell cycle sensor histidine kinase and response regulator CckA
VVGLWIDDRITDGIVFWSDYSRLLHGFGADAVLTPALLFERMHPEDRKSVAAEIQRSLVTREPFDAVIRVKYNDQDYRALRVFGGTHYDRAGRPLTSMGGMVDCAPLSKLQDRVRELEEQLLTAQRRDAVGRLVGGIAHDFNNLLTGILGCCEMLSLADLTADQLADVQQIRAATLSGAELTRQLLAYGRRQVLRRQPVDPAGVLGNVLNLLRRTVPENI